MLLKLLTADKSGYRSIRVDSAKTSPPIAVSAMALARSVPFFAELRKRHDPEFVIGEELSNTFLRGAWIDRCRCRFGRAEVVGPARRQSQSPFVIIQKKHVILPDHPSARFIRNSLRTHDWRVEIRSGSRIDFAASPSGRRITSSSTDEYIDTRIPAGNGSVPTMIKRNPFRS